MTWSIRKLFSFSHSFIFCTEICNPTDIGWMVVTQSLNLRAIGWFSIATQRILVGLQLWKWEVEKRLKLHNLRIDRVVIQTEPKYSIGARNADYWGVDFVWKIIGTVQFRVGNGPGSDPGIWTLCEHKLRPTTFWRFVWAARTYVLQRRSLALTTSRWQPFDTFLTQKRLSKPPDHSFNMLVQRHFNCQKDNCSHQVCLQRTSLDDNQKSLMSAKSRESTII